MHEERGRGWSKWQRDERRIEETAKREREERENVLNVKYRLRQGSPPSHHRAAEGSWVDGRGVADCVRPFVHRARPRKHGGGLAPAPTRGRRREKRRRAKRNKNVKRDSPRAFPSSDVCARMRSSICMYARCVCGVIRTTLLSVCVCVRANRSRRADRRCPRRLHM